MTILELYDALGDLEAKDGAEIFVRTALGTNEPIAEVGLDPDGTPTIILDLKAT